jgi:hypothetical protein
MRGTDLYRVALDGSKDPVRIATDNYTISAIATDASNVYWAAGVFSGDFLNSHVSLASLSASPL